MRCPAKVYRPEVEILAWCGRFLRHFEVAASGAEFSGAADQRLYRFIAAIRFAISSGVTSSRWVAIDQLFPNASVTVAMRSPQN
jgi:hypothetical protein